MKKLCLLLAIVTLISGLGLLGSASAVNAQSGPSSEAFESGLRDKEKGDWEKAVSAFQRAVDGEPGNIGFKLELAGAFVRLGKLSEAREVLEAAYALNSSDYETAHQLASVYSWTDRFDDARAIYTKILVADPGDVASLVAMARLAAWQGRHDEAFQQLSAIVADHPDNLEARINLGRVLSWQKRFSEAEVQYETVLKEVPDHFEALVELGRMASWNERYSESEKYYRAALKKSPDDLDALRGLANTYKWSRQWKKAIDIHRRIIAKRPNDLPSTLETAHIYQESGQDLKAIEWFQKAQDLAPERQDIHAQLGLLYARTAQLDSSVTELKKALALNQGDIDSYVSLGRVLSWQNKLDESAALYRKALEISPDNVEAKLGLARVHFYAGRWTDATGLYEEVLSVRPTHVEAREGLEQVRRARAPVLTVRGESFRLREYDEDARQFQTRFVVPAIGAEYRHTFSQGKSAELRYRTGAFDEKDTTSGTTDYRLRVDQVSASADWKIRKRLFAAGRFEGMSFRNDGANQSNLAETKYFASGYLMGRYELKRWLFVGSAGQEPAVDVDGSFIELDALRNYIFSVEYDAAPSIEIIPSYEVQDFPDRADRIDYGSKVSYVPSLLPQAKLGYEARFLDEPQEKRNIGSIRYQGKVRGRHLWEFLYEASNSSLIPETEHFFKLFTRVDIGPDWALNLSGGYGFEKLDDRDKTDIWQIYVQKTF